MIAENKYLSITKGLLEKTKRRKVPWKPADNMGEPRSEPATAFRLELPHSIVIVAFHSPVAGNDFVMLTMHDDRGNVAGSWRVEEGEDDWPVAYELYLEVSRQVNKWDKVLEEVEQFIGKP